MRDRATIYRHGHATTDGARMPLLNLNGRTMTGVSWGKGSSHSKTATTFPPCDKFNYRPMNVQHNEMKDDTSCNEYDFKRYGDAIMVGAHDVTLLF